MLKITELDRFSRTAGRIIAQIKEQNERFALVISQFGDRHIRIGQFKIWRSVAIVQHVFHSSRKIESII
jgi:hypothetical protein